VDDTISVYHQIVEIFQQQAIEKLLLLHQRSKPIPLNPREFVSNVEQ